MAEQRQTNQPHLDEPMQELKYIGPYLQSRFDAFYHQIFDYPENVQVTLRMVRDAFLEDDNHCFIGTHNFLRSVYLLLK